MFESDRINKGIIVLTKSEIKHQETALAKFQFVLIS